MERDKKELVLRKLRNIRMQASRYQRASDDPERLVRDLDLIAATAEKTIKELMGETDE